MFPEMMSRTLSLKPQSIPVIDLFAGPGGLGEGFSSLGQEMELDGRPRQFRIALSIEKDPVAHQTLQLRSFYRQFPYQAACDEYYAYLRGQLSRDELYARFPNEYERARDEAWCAELGGEDFPPALIHSRIRKALGSAKEWVLIGGPPCQAYSLVGRSRNRGIADYRPELDRRHVLYREYLQVIAEHHPTVFVMENVKGLLSSKLDDALIFHQILEDLQSPGAAASGNSGKKARKACPDYDILALAPEAPADDSLLERVLDARDYIVRMERHGIPQARHRVILLGVRKDLGPVRLPTLPLGRVTASQVLKGLPSLRSGLSREKDSDDLWCDALAGASRAPWVAELYKTSPDVHARILQVLGKLSCPSRSRGAEFLEHSPQTDQEPSEHREWYIDRRLGGVCNHSTRAHIASDLHRYLFVACFGVQRGKSPTLRDFPESLLPKHGNATAARDGRNGMFSDRFRVQLSGMPSTTITSHISKDGHYYVHYDPAQCRSLTVREAARLQTFPDNYYFCGPRTEQYHQVGNAVPPLLALRIAEAVANLLQKAGVR